MKMVFNKITVLTFLAISNVMTVIIFYALGIQNSLLFLLSIFGYIPFYIGTIMYFKPSAVLQSAPDNQSVVKTLSCPKCRADNTTRCMIHTVWVRNDFNPNWRIWKCPNCEIELTISLESKKRIMITSIILVVVFLISILNQFIPGVLFAFGGFLIIPSIMLGYSGRLIEAKKT